MPKGGSKPGERRGGRQKGTPNKLTSLAREAIETAAAKLGGANRLVKWAKESASNERAFWTLIYPKLLPLQVTGSGDGPTAHYFISDRPRTKEEWKRECCGE
jgi:hypothetical protein